MLILETVWLTGLHDQAVQQTSGKQRQQYESWRKTLITCLAHVEAVLDFGDDNDIESNVADEVAPTVQALRRDLEHHLAEGKHRLVQAETQRARLLLCAACNPGATLIAGWSAGWKPSPIMQIHS